MGQKIHPTGFRLPVTRNWSSRWYASNKNFATMLAEDLKVREFLKARLKNAAVSRILIERPAKNARITIFSARPGVVIGKKGEDIETLRADLRKMMGGDVGLNIEEIRKPEIDAQLIADSSAFLMIPAAFFCVKLRMLIAWSTFLPRTRSATSRPLSAERRTPRTIDLVSIVAILTSSRPSCRPGGP